MKVWILAVPFVLGSLAGCPKGEQQPQQPDYSQPPAEPQPTMPPEEGQPPTGWEQFGQQGQQPGQPGQPGELGQPGEPGQPGQPGGLAQAPDFATALGQLRTYAQEIRASQDLQHEDVVAGFNALAEAVRTMPNAAGVDVTGVTTNAQQLAASDPMSTEHAAMAKNALNESLRALETMMREQNITGMDERLAQIRTQIEAIDPATPLLQQKDAVANGLDQMAQVMDELSQRPPSGTQ